MRSEVILLALLLLSLLLLGCSGVKTINEKSIVTQNQLQQIKVSEAAFQAKITEAIPIIQKYDTERTYDNLLYNNEAILNKTTGWRTVKTSHNPLLLNLQYREELFKTCYWIVRPYMVTLADEVRYKEEYYPITNYNTLLCLHGYPVYQSKIREQILSGINYYDDSKTVFSINKIIPDIYTEEELEKQLGLTRHELYTKYGQLMPFGMGSFLRAWGNTQIALQETLFEVKDQKQKSGPELTTLNDESEMNWQTAKPTQRVTEYDFPKIKMNKQDIYDSFNYNSILQKALSGYNKIGLDVSEETYTFRLQDGKIQDITNGLDSDVDFKIKTSWEDLKNLIVLHKEGNTVAGMNAFWNLDMPLRVKLQVASRIGISH